MPQLNGNTYEAFTPEKQITIDGQKYTVRSRVVYDNKGQTGTIDTTKPIQNEFQYKPEPSFGDPFPSFAPLATRTNDKSVNNGWLFTGKAGPGFKKKLIETGPTSLTATTDTATTQALAKDAKVPVARAQQSLNTAPNKALPGTAANQDPNAPAGGQNQAQAAAQAAASTGATPLTKVEDLQAAVGKSKKSRADFPTTLRYPLELNSSKQDKIKFDMVEYRPAGATSAQGQFGLNRASERSSKTIGTVFLPIPSGISDTTGCNWGSDTADAAKIAAANVAMGTITEGGTGFTREIENVLKTAQGDSKGVGGAVSTAIAGDLSGMGGGLLTRVTGAVLNPNLELLFNGGTLRTFSFTFKMSARSEEEAKQIIGILRFFKQGMAPKKSDSNLFLLSPHTFKITYIHKNQTDPHKFLNRFKECALLNLTTNYTPEGQYATFHDGPMVSYEMQMQFQELEPVFNEDYGPGTGSGGPDTEIGF